MKLYEVRARFAHWRQTTRERAGERARAIAAFIFGRASLFLLSLVVVGGAILVAMSLVMSVGPLQGLTLDQKLALLQIVGGVIGFGITLFAVLVAFEEFRYGTARPLIHMTIETRPTKLPSGATEWEMNWNVTNEGERACQWFSVELAIGWVMKGSHRFPNGRFILTQLDAPFGGKWSRKIDQRGSPPPTPGGFPAWFHYQSNGEVSVFDHVGVAIGGPSFQIESDERSIYIWCILRGSGAPARHHAMTLDATTGTLTEHSESLMTRHRPGAR